MHEPSDLKKLFDGAWGILEGRRKEIEDGPFGTYDRVLDEEVRKHFQDIKGVAEAMVVHESTARRWMIDCECQYIIHQGLAFFEKTDVKRIAKLRKEIQKARKKKDVK